MSRKRQMLCEKQNKFFVDFTKKFYQLFFLAR